MGSPHSLENILTMDLDLHGGPVVETLHCHSRKRGFSPWLGNYNPTCHVVQPEINI